MKAYCKSVFAFSPLSLREGVRGSIDKRCNGCE